MKKLTKKSALIIRIVSFAALLLLAVLSIFSFRSGVISGFTGENGLVILSLELPVVYILLSVAFTAVYLAVLVLGAVYKDTVISSITVVCSLMIIAAIVMLGLFTSGTLYGSAALWTTFILISPFYGTLWAAGLFAVIIYAAATAASVVFLIKSLAKGQKASK